MDAPGSIDVLICDEAHRIRTTSVSRFTRKDQRSGKEQIDELLDVAKVVAAVNDGASALPTPLWSGKHDPYATWTPKFMALQATMIERAGSTDAFLQRAEGERRELATTRDLCGRRADRCDLGPLERPIQGGVALQNFLVGLGLETLQHPQRAGADGAELVLRGADHRRRAEILVAHRAIESGRQRVAHLRADRVHPARDGLIARRAKLRHAVEVGGVFGESRLRFAHDRPAFGVGDRVVRGDHQGPQILDLLDHAYAHLFLAAVGIGDDETPQRREVAIDVADARRVRAD
ncbi:MAG: DNA/RNA helicase domain-containing protein [Tagaea sp.]